VTATNDALRVYSHRVNTLDALRALPGGLGVEFDLRDDGRNILITHDPFTTGPTIDEFFPLLRGRPSIFNVKCEGIEEHVRRAAQKYGVEDYFFLDLTVPAAVKLARQGETRLAVRYSEHEPLEGVLAWRGRARWVWVDCFTRWPEDPTAWATIARDFQVCLVSPELQGHGAGAIATFREGLGTRTANAVCTKRPDLWGFGPPPRSA
jgi:hypothetical protein